MDTEVSITGIAEKYFISSQHRSKRPKKSFWLISITKEISCFKQSMVSGWKNNDDAWGLYLSNGIALVLGKNKNGEEVKIAKFVNSSGINTWHGYPADYIGNTQDKPTTSILQMWVCLSYIGKADMAKILRGLKCSL